MQRYDVQQTCDVLSNLRFIPQTALGLADWTSGTFVAARDFNIALAERYYTEALTEMARIKTKSLTMYHRVMHQVYKNVWYVTLPLNTLSLPSTHRSDAQ